MEARGLASMLMDGLVTILAVWLSFILAGLACDWLQPSLAGAALSVALCVGLLFAYARWTGPGRRTVLPVYLLGSLLYPLASVTLMIVLPPTLVLGPLQWLSAGLVVGLQPGGGPDAPGEIYVLPMLLNLFVPVLIMSLLRHWAGDRDTA